MPGAALDARTPGRNTAKSLSQLTCPATQTINRHCPKVTNSMKSLLHSFFPPHTFPPTVSGGKRSVGGSLSQARALCEDNYGRLMFVLQYPFFPSYKAECEQGTWQPRIRLHLPASLTVLRPQG